MTSRRLRDLVDLYVRGCMPGTRINAHKLVRKFSNRNRCLTPLRISLFLRERADLKHEAVNEWIVVGA
jgi:hypothetical protein